MNERGRTLEAAGRRAGVRDAPALLLALFPVGGAVFTASSGTAGNSWTAVSQDGSSISGFSLRYEISVNRWSFSMRSSDDTGSALDQALSTAPPSTGTWTHLVGVYDSTAQQIQLYVDGVLQATTAHLSAWNATGNLEIGRARWSGADTDWWHGSIDGVRVYQSALGAADVTALHQDADPPTTFTEADLTAGVLGALQGPQQGLQSSTALAFAGSANVYDDTVTTDPAPFTVECWFRASGSAGGALVGFGASPTGMAAEDTDRLVYLNHTQHVVFRVNPGPATALTSPLTYADGTWHHLAASVGAAGMRLYLDGVPVASDVIVTSAQNLTGYWRWGGSPLAGLADRPPSDYLVGSLDELAVYPGQLTDAQIAEHYHADR
jgi:hypothetical protein